MVNWWPPSTDPVTRAWFRTALQHHNIQTSLTVRTGKWLVSALSHSNAADAQVSGQGPEFPEWRPNQSRLFDRLRLNRAGARGKAWRLVCELRWFSSCSAACNRPRADGDPPPTAQANPRPVNFSRDVRPILSDQCFACHGPDDKARKASLRLDTKEGAFAKLKDGGLTIVPGKPGESELVVRIESDDPDLHMPPKKSGKKLTGDQVAILRRWVEQGGAWSTHWAFETPQKPSLPTVKNAGWVGNEIDRFILARLEAEGLSPSPPAARTTLIRRVTLDLTGLPPTLREVDAFLADSSKEAYEKVVDRLLDSPRYGEHMARFWLDAARYGDTHGLHLDNYREAWPYRDWVIHAFNANKPFDRFIVEQLAGDFLAQCLARPDHRHRLQPLPRIHQRRGLDRRGSLRS